VRDLERKAIIKEGDLYFALNTSILPPVPPYGDPWNEDCSPRHVLTRSWSSRSHPELAYIPETPRFQGPLLGRLAGSFKQWPIVFSKKLGYHLNLELCDSWYRLELVLRHTCAALMDGFFLGMTSIETIPIPVPEKCGYTKFFPTESKARGAAQHSRDAFVILMAKVSYAISLHIPCYTPDTPYPKWAQNLKDKIPPHYIDLIMSSQLADFSKENPRISVFITKDCDYPSAIPKMLKSGCPVWFCYDQQNPHAYRYSSQGGFHDSLRPRVAEVQAAHDAFLPTAPPDIPIPSPEQGSRQLRGETWKAFFERESILQIKRAAEESFQARKIRLQREKQAKKYHIPGRGGAVVWCWEDINGHCIRTRIIRGNVERIWEMYSDLQRRYNSFDNEWDICDEFDPNWPYPMTGELDIVQGSEGIADHFAEVQQHRSPSPPPAYPVSPAPPTISDIADNDLCIAYGMRDQRQPVRYVIPPQILLDVLHTRYGFNLHIHSSPETDYDLFAFPISQDSLKSTLRLFREGTQTVPFELQPAVVRFVEGLVRKKPKDGSITSPTADVVVPSEDVSTAGEDVTSPPPWLWDLDNSNPLPLSIRYGAPLLVRPEEWEGKLLYFLQFNDSPNPETEYRLAVPSALTALECLRLSYPSLHSRMDIVKYLFRTGQRFTTLLPFNPSHPKRYIMSCAGLGWRNAGYQPTPFDYRHYENERDDFFLYRHRRAAASEGGIVWRLFMESLGVDLSAIFTSDAGIIPAIDDVLFGPSISHYGDQQYFKSGSETLWDDHLTDAEMDLISGVYKVWTRKCSPHYTISFTNSSTEKNQTSDFSWWPKHSTWMSSTMNVGYWTADCEKWFQARLTEIRNGTATLKTASEWRTALKLFKSTPQFVAANEYAAARFIQHIS
jgi:hypothetical protein